jgi:hypothetical protein
VAALKLALPVSKVAALGVGVNTQAVEAGGRYAYPLTVWWRARRVEGFRGPP